MSRKKLANLLFQELEGLYAEHQVALQAHRELVTELQSTRRRMLLIKEQIELEGNELEMP